MNRIVLLSALAGTACLLLPEARAGERPKVVSQNRRVIHVKEGQDLILKANTAGPGQVLMVEPGAYAGCV